MWAHEKPLPYTNFPSFSEGLSLGEHQQHSVLLSVLGFPFLFGGTFIEGTPATQRSSFSAWISLPFRRDFH